MGALIKKANLESGRHSFEASGPSLPFRTVNQAAESPVAAATIKQIALNVSSRPVSTVRCDAAICPELALNDEKRCPLECRQVGDKQTRPTGSELFALTPSGLREHSRDFPSGLSQ